MREGEGGAKRLAKVVHNWREEVSPLIVDKTFSDNVAFVHTEDKLILFSAITDRHG
jgi:hypothetical protein